MNRMKLTLNERELHTVTACAAAIENIIKKHNPDAIMPATRLKSIIKDVIAGQTVVAALQEPIKYNSAGDLSALAYAAYVAGDIKDALQHQLVAWSFEDAPILFDSIVKCNAEATTEEDLGGEPEGEGVEESNEDLPDEELDDQTENDGDELNDDENEEPEIDDDDEELDFDDDDENAKGDESDLEDDNEPEDVVEEDEFTIPQRGILEDDLTAEPEAESEYENPEEYVEKLNDAVENVVASIMNGVGDAPKDADDFAQGNTSKVDPIDNVAQENKEAKDKPSGSLITGDPVMASLIKQVRKLPKGNEILKAANRISADGNEDAHKRAKIFLRRVINVQANAA